MGDHSSDTAILSPSAHLSHRRSLNAILSPVFFWDWWVKQCWKPYFEIDCICCCSPPEGLLLAVEIKYIFLVCFPLNKSSADCISSPCYLPNSDKWFDLFLQELGLIGLIYKSPSYSFFSLFKELHYAHLFFQFSSSLTHSSLGSQKWMLIVLQLLLPVLLTPSVMFIRPCLSESLLISQER